MTLPTRREDAVYMRFNAVCAQLVIAAYCAGAELIEDVIGLCQFKPGGIHPAHAPVAASRNDVVPATTAICPG